MSTLGTQLRDGDPLADAPALPPLDVQRIRRAAIAEAGRPAAPWSPQPLEVAASVAATLAAGVVVGQQLPRQTLLRAGNVERPDAGVPSPDDRRQVQFDTPGGTRIIWVIDPDFDL